MTTVESAQDRGELSPHLHHAEVDFAGVVFAETMVICSESDWQKLGQDSVWTLSLVRRASTP
jgi:hypothetical protein